MISRILLAAACLAIPAAGFAESWSDLPAEMVLVNSTIEAAQTGLVIPRIVHARTRQAEGDFTQIDIHFLSAYFPENWVPGDCDDTSFDCMGNVQGSLQINRRNQPIGDNGDVTAQVNLGGSATIGQPMTDLAYHAEILGTLLAPGAQVSQEGSDWVITNGYGVLAPQVWRDMSLTDAADAALFIGDMAMSKQQIGSCVIDQISAIDRTGEVSQAEQELLAAMELSVGRARASAEESSAGQDRSGMPDAIFRVLAAYSLAEAPGDLPDGATVLQSPALANQIKNFGEGALIGHTDQIVQAAAYMRRQMALEQLSTEDRVKIVCSDLSGLGAE